MSTHHHIPLVSSELGSLMISYSFISMQSRVFQYFTNVAEDDDIRFVLNQAGQQTDAILQKFTALMQDDGLPLPFAFTEKDVDVNALFGCFYTAIRKGSGRDGDQSPGFSLKREREKGYAGFICGISKKSDGFV